MIRYFVFDICQKPRETTLDFPARTFNVFGIYDFQSSARFNGYIWWLNLCVAQPCRTGSKAQNSSCRGFSAPAVSIPRQVISGSLLPVPRFKCPPAAQTHWMCS